jgi:hypothetical protein
MAAITHQQGMPLSIELLASGFRIVIVRLEHQYVAEAGQQADD